MTHFDDGPLRFERRLIDRWDTTGVAAAYCVAGEGFGRRYTLRILDESADGLGVRCSRPIEPGTLLSLAFAQPGTPMRNGVVLRCLPGGDGYRLAIQFEQRLAA